MLACHARSEGHIRRYLNAARSANREYRVYDLIARGRALLLAVGLSASVTACTPDSREGVDFSGVWQAASGEGNDKPLSEEERVEEMFSPLVMPGGEPVLKEPYASAYRAHLSEKEAAAASGKAWADPHTQCELEGMPHMMAPTMLMEIVHIDTKIVFLLEYLGQTRRVYLNEKMPPADEIAPSLSGYSVGRWEGDTLVVETRGIRADAMFYHIPHSDQLRIVERFRRMGDRMENRLVVEDPKALAEPYVISFDYQLAPPQYKVSEYLCENNRYKNDQGEDTLDTTLE